MIQFLADNIDQLDLALDQLAVGDRNFDRFALMLIDNVVELTLHRFARDKASENEIWTRLKAPKHDPKLIAQALSQNFDQKVKAASKLGLINTSACESILNLHSYRNATYHKGLRHEGILHSLAVFYFRIVCDLLKTYKPRYWAWSSGDQISYRAKKYLGGSSTVGTHEKKFNDAYLRLEEVATSMPEDLVGDLSADLALTIDRIDDSINFLANDGPKKLSRDVVIIDAQVWPFLFTDEAKAFAKSNGFAGRTIPAYTKWLEANYNWPIKTDPIPKWRNRLETLKKESDYHKALKLYCDFMHQTDDIRSKINESAVQLDAHIQHQIDVARGK